MAKLAPKDPQFGIPVATRIREEIAFKFNKEAAKADMTLSRYLAEFIERAIPNEKRLTELENLLAKERDISKKVIGRFIMELAQRDKAKATELIEIYNTILRNEKSK